MICGNLSCTVHSILQVLSAGLLEIFRYTCNAMRAVTILVMMPAAADYTSHVGIKYSKPFVCICKHTATRIRIWRGCPTEVGYLTVSVSWPSALHCNPCPHCSPHPNSSNLDGCCWRYISMTQLGHCCCQGDYCDQLSTPFPV